MRRVTLLLLFGSLGLAGWLLSAAPSASSRAPAPPGKPNTLRLPRIRPGEELASKLSKDVDWAGIDDPKTTLIEALDQFAKVHQVTFDINEKAFKDDKVDAIVKVEIANPNPLPGVKSSLGMVLKRILARVPAKSGATWMIRRDHIEITTGAAVRAEVMGKDYIGPMLPLVCMTADRKPLDEVVAYLADQGERNVAIDPRVGEKAQAPITAYLVNKPLDSALFLVADMAGLSFVRIDNTYYITTTDRAASMKADWKAHRPSEAAPATVKSEAAGKK
jgi:hypothetical protein